MKILMSVDDVMVLSENAYTYYENAYNDLLHTRVSEIMGMKKCFSKKPKFTTRGEAIKYLEKNKKIEDYILYAFANGTDIWCLYRIKQIIKNCNTIKNTTFDGSEPKILLSSEEFEILTYGNNHVSKS